MQLSWALLLSSHLLLASTLSAQTAAATNDDSVAHFGTTVFSSGFEGTIYYVHRGTQHLPDFTKLKPKGTIYTHSLNVKPQHFDAGFPGLSTRFEWFAIAYTARFWITKPGPYQFWLQADDGADLFVDSAMVVNNDGQHPPVTLDGVVQLTPGLHQMRVLYYQGPKWQVALVLKVQGPDEAGPVVFNTDDFKPPN